MWYYSVDRTVPKRGKGGAMSALANVIREWLDHNNKGQNWLASEAKIRTSTLSHLLNKENALPRPATVKKLAHAMNIEGVILTALLGYPVQASDDPNGQYVEIARQLAAFPWLVHRLNDLLHLEESEFEEMMNYLRFRRQQGTDRSNP
jgi:transcriptional regulator with XRE-family HTH domain